MRNENGSFPLFELYTYYWFIKYITLQHYIC